MQVHEEELRLLNQHCNVLMALSAHLQSAPINLLESDSLLDFGDFRNTG